MGKNVLARGLIPATDDAQAPPARLQFDLLWAMLSFHTHRFGGRPISEMLVSWTMIILMDRGYAPTIADIAKATGVPRPTVSRYVAHQIEQGWIEERVNPDQRRRRELFWTETGVSGMEFILDYFHDLMGDIQAKYPDDSESQGGDALLTRMRTMSEKIVKDIA